MKRIVTLMFALALVTAFAGVASAHPYACRVDRREAMQRFRIRQGVRQGQLTRGEAMRLRMGERRIRRIDGRAQADGFYGPRERFRINRAQRHESRMIHRLRHNGREA